MKIAYIAAGAGGMYCGMCLHDNTLAAALVKQGADVLLIPTYTPLKTDEEDVSERRIFFGGINVYLEQKVALFRRLPAWLTRPLDQRWLLKLATRRAGSVDPTKLGDLTVSMLQGAHGHQRRELDQLAAWLETDVRPDVVHLSNAMLIGMAEEFERRLHVPIVSSLMGEDVFLERLIEPYYGQARELMKDRAGRIDRFVALNRYYADYMAEWMAFDPADVEIIPHGLNLQGHGSRQDRPGEETIHIGYMARVCRDKGLHLLVEAFIQLANDASLPPLKLLAAGYLGDGDRKYFRQVQKRIEKAGLSDRFRYLGEPDRAGKIAFLQSLDVMALPTIYRESKGLSALEAMANAVPLVVPDHGAFPELIEDTGGGLLCAPEDATALAERLAELIRDRRLRDRLGRAGQAAIRQRYHADLMAERTVQLYQRAIKRAASVASEAAV